MCNDVGNFQKLTLFYQLSVNTHFSKLTLAPIGDFQKFTLFYQLNVNTHFDKLTLAPIGDFQKLNHIIPI